MKAFVLMFATVLPSVAKADSRCIVLEGSTLINNCRDCAEVTVRELRPPAEQASGLYTGVSHTVRLEGGSRETLAHSEGWIIRGLKACR